MGCLGCEKNVEQHKAGVNVKRSTSKRKHKSRPHRVDNAKEVSQNSMDRLHVFGLSSVKDFIVFYELLDVVGATLDDVKSWVKAETNKEVETDAREMLAIRGLSMFMNARPACPGCGKQLHAMHVNTNPRNQVGGKWTFIIHCNDDEDCGWDDMISGTLQDHVAEAKMKDIYNFIHLNPGGKEK